MAKKKPTQQKKGRKPETQQTPKKTTSSASPTPPAEKSTRSDSTASFEAKLAGLRSRLQDYGIQGLTAEDQALLQELPDKIPADFLPVYNALCACLKYHQELIREAKELGAELSDPLKEIPQDRQTRPMTLKEMATFWGGGMTPEKLKTHILKGIVRAVPLTRQAYVFDIKSLPGSVVKALQRENER